MNDFKERVKMISQILLTKNEELKAANDLENKVRKEMDKETKKVMIRSQHPHSEIGGFSPEDDLAQLE